jgi:hypothetical protein
LSFGSYIEDEEEFKDAYDFLSKSLIPSGSA